MNIDPAWITWVYLLCLLTLGHYLADFALQNNFVAQQKTYAGRTAMGNHALVAHCAHHALVAAVAAWVLGCDPVIAGVAIGGTHLAIDLGKIRGMYGINTDQVFHLVAIVCTAAVLVLQQQGI